MMDKTLITPEPPDEDFFSCPDTVQAYVRELEMRYWHGDKINAAPPVADEEVRDAVEYIETYKMGFGENGDRHLSVLCRAATAQKSCKNCDDKDADVWVKCHDDLFDKHEAMKKSCDALVKALDSVRPVCAGAKMSWAVNLIDQALSAHRKTEGGE